MFLGELASFSRYSVDTAVHLKTYRMLSIRAIWGCLVVSSCVFLCQLMDIVRQGHIFVGGCFVCDAFMNGMVYSVPLIPSIRVFLFGRCLQ